MPGRTKRALSLSKGPPSYHPGASPLGIAFRRQSPHAHPQQLYAELYDTAVPDWPGEIDFYRDRVVAFGGARLDVLEVACVTGQGTWSRGP